jgi:hypothetical protein
LFGLSAADPLTLIAAAIVLTLVALLAGYCLRAAPPA